MTYRHLKNKHSDPTLDPWPEEPTPAITKRFIMVYVISIAVIVLGLGVWQEQIGSGHSESDLGSERHGQPSQTT
jgi:hypothetical protein